jgi:hypothetical protein
MTKLERTIANLGLTYTAEFIPQKFSRNADDKQPSINWRITISNGKNFITTDYTQGIGHIPTVAKSYKHFNRENELLASSTGTYNTSATLHWRNPKKLPTPNLINVLYSLTLDSDVCDYCGFEEWANNYGYNSDSISHRSIYEKCIIVSKQFRKIVDLPYMRKLFEDTKGTIMRADLREIELCFYAFKKETKDKQKSVKMIALIADLETLMQLLITQAELEGDLQCIKN